jgi:hypothetical protein
MSPDFSPPAAGKIHEIFFVVSTANDSIEYGRSINAVYAKEAIHERKI